MPILARGTALHRARSMFSLAASQLTFAVGAIGVRK